MEDVMGFNHADDANVPVDIWLMPRDDGKWILYASCYQPRRMQVLEHAFEFVADTRAECVKVLQEHVIPMYVLALNELHRIAAGATNHLYYWHETSSIQESNK